MCFQKTNPFFKTQIIQKANLLFEIRVLLNQICVLKFVFWQIRVLIITWNSEKQIRVYAKSKFAFQKANLRLCKKANLRFCFNIFSKHKFDKTQIWKHKYDLQKHKFKKHKFVFYNKEQICVIKSKSVIWKSKFVVLGKRKFVFFKFVFYGINLCFEQNYLCFKKQIRVL